MDERVKGLTTGRRGRECRKPQDGGRAWGAIGRPKIDEPRRRGADPLPFFQR